jgi:hypothetical protein
MKRAKGTRRAPIDPSEQVRDLAVTPTAGAGVKGGEEEEKRKAASKLLDAAVKGKVFQKVEIHGTA